MRLWSLALLVFALSGCMKVSDMAEGTRYHLRDVGILDHSETRRAASWRLQADSFIYVAQAHFVPPGDAYPRPNVVAERVTATVRAGAWLRSVFSSGSNRRSTSSTMPSGKTPPRPRAPRR